jgi:hypothetical protein
MKPGSFGASLVLLALLAGCTGGLPRELQRDIAREVDAIHNAESQLHQQQNTLRQNLAEGTDVLRATAAAAEWGRALQSAQEKLNRAKREGETLTQLARNNRADSRGQVERLLREEKALRAEAGNEASRAVGESARWSAFSRDLPGHVQQVEEKYASLQSFDLTPTSKAVEQAEKDWPAKKDELERRLASVRQIPESLAASWKSTEAARQDARAGNVTGEELGALVTEQDSLEQGLNKLNARSKELQAASGQLYEAWDKILTDLDDSRDGSEGLYRERIKTVRTHMTDPTHKGQVTSDEHWVNVPEADFRAVKDDLGMAIAHKDAGLFDSEAQTTPQPPGYAYIAPESQGSNQYGYWTHRDGQSFWTFLPEYLILRELLWSHSYRPVTLGDYTAYRMAQRAGQSYYGRETPTAPPKYGTHGTFTQKQYASSRYAQKGNFSGSAYSSGGSSGKSAFSRADQDDHHGFSVDNGTAGRRFGTGAAPSSGRRFGTGAAPSSGRRFGLGGGSRGMGRGFGRGRR